MFDKWFNLPAHLYLKLTALTILMVGVALSNVLMSIGTIWIISNWIIEGDFRQYWTRFKVKKSVWLIVVLFFFLMLSFSWSTNIEYGIKDLRVKLPFIVIPLVLATSTPLQKKHFYFLQFVFLGIVAYTSGYNYIRYNFFLPAGADIREMSTFISHVRFSVLVNIGLFVSLYLGIKKKLHPLISLVLISWFLFYTYEAQVLNGYLLLFVLSIFSFWYGLYYLRNRAMKISATIVFLAVLVIGLVQLKQLVNSLKTPEIINYSTLDLQTKNGNDYFHDTLNKQLENGNYIWLYVSTDELKAAWHKRSKIDYDSLDAKGQPMYGSLMRYLTSKGLRKDAEGVEALTDLEVQHIENGVTSCEVNDGLVTRMNAFLLEYLIYEDGGDPNGSSIIQRVEHFKAAKELINDNWITGVGVGDVPDAFKRQYKEMNSLLLEANQHRSHNQFLTIWVAGGILAFVLFVGILLVPLFENKHKDYFFWIVLIALYVSCLFQDIIETQAGVTLFALFYAVAIYRERSPERE